MVRYAQVAANPRAPLAQRGSLGRLGRREALGRNTQDRVWVGRQALPDLALAGQPHTREVAPQVEQVEDDLEVQVRRPVAVVRRRTNRADPLPARHRLPDPEAVERVKAQMAVQRVEWLAVTCRMLEHYERAIV